MNPINTIQHIGRFNVAFCGVAADKNGTVYETVRIEEFDGDTVIQDRILYLTHEWSTGFNPFSKFSLQSEFDSEQKVLQYLKYPNYTRLHVSEHKIQCITERS